MKYIFLDTNAFIHYRFPDEIKWKEHLNVKDFVIIVTPQVISEIDKHKYSDRNKLRKRSLKVIKKFEDLFLSADEGSNSMFKLSTESGTNESIEKAGFDPNDGDDLFLWSVYQYINQNNIVSKNYIVITADIGMKMKCKSRGISYAGIPDEYLLPFEKDKYESENLALKKEIHLLNNRKPSISIKIKDHEICNSSLDYTEIVEKENWISRNMEKLRNTVLFLDRNGNGIKRNSSNIDRRTMIPKFLRPSLADIGEYNNDLKTYFEKVESILSSNYEARKIIEHSVKLELVIYNDGTEPAENTDIIIKSKQGLYIYHSDIIPTISAYPNPPRKPESSITLATISSNIPLASIRRKSISLDVKENVIQIDESTLKIHVGKIKHNSKVAIKTVHLRYREGDIPEKVILEVEASCDNLIAVSKSILILE